MGCFKDVPNKRDFTIWKGMVLNVKQCVAKCEADKQAYAAIQVSERYSFHMDVDSRCSSSCNKSI